MNQVVRSFEDLRQLAVLTSKPAKKKQPKETKKRKGEQRHDLADAPEDIEGCIQVMQITVAAIYLRRGWENAPKLASFIVDNFAADAFRTISRAGTCTVRFAYLRAFEEILNLSGRFVREKLKGMSIQKCIDSMQFPAVESFKSDSFVCISQERGRRGELVCCEEATLASTATSVAADAQFMPSAKSLVSYIDTARTTLPAAIRSIEMRQMHESVPGFELLLFADAANAIGYNRMLPEFDIAGMREFVGAFLAESIAALQSQLQHPSNAVVWAMLLPPESLTASSVSAEDAVAAFEKKDTDADNERMSIIRQTLSADIETMLQEVLEKLQLLESYVRARMKKQVRRPSSAPQVGEIPPAARKPPVAASATTPAVALEAVRSDSDVSVEVSVFEHFLNINAGEAAALITRENLHQPRVCEQLWPGVLWVVVFGPVPNLLDIDNELKQLEMLLVAPIDKDGSILTKEAKAVSRNDWESYFSVMATTEN